MVDRMELAGQEPSLDEVVYQDPKSEARMGELAGQERCRDELDCTELWTEQGSGARSEEDQLALDACYDTTQPNAERAQIVFPDGRTQGDLSGEDHSAIA
jgi:hypothetical protein